MKDKMREIVIAESELNNIRIFLELGNRQLTFTGVSSVTHACGCLFITKGSERIGVNMNHVLTYSIGYDILDKQEG